MRKVIKEIKRINTEKITSVDEVVKELIDYLDNDYFGEEYYEEESASIDEFRDIIGDILTYYLDIENTSDEEFDEIVMKTYPVFVEKFNEFRDKQKDYEKSLFKDRNSIRDELSNWFDYEEDICLLTLDEVIDLIIENGNK